MSGVCDFRTLNSTPIGKVGPFSFSLLIGGLSVSDRSVRPLGGLLQGQRLVEVQAAALASVSDAVMITDREGVIVWVNEAFTKMSGYRAEEAVGATPRLLKSGEQDESYYRRLWETILACLLYTSPSPRDGLLP